MTAEEFRLIRDLVRERSGLHFGEETRYVFERRVRERCAALGISTFVDYYRLLRVDAKGEAELQELYDLLATKETYFFREEYQLAAFREEVLPVLLQEAASRRRLSVWSAGCSTGEEAYSIAIVLVESGMFDGWALRVHGTDLSRRCLAAARKGIYAETSFRATNEERRRRFFVEREDGTHVSEMLRGLCHFGLMNLVHMQRSPSFMQLDVVFCKNVLIYFDAESRKRVLNGLYDRLRPGGYLLLGHSESLLNETTRFEVVHLKGDVVYRRPNTRSSPPYQPRKRAG
ncbi:MAG: protein-glutamate O-methyltransferase CheR [Deltaproteobacteria bacterium]|nr:protein-glutamate O-methyltransferase CheR [Deltaproteobacteria bacterium]